MPANLTPQYLSAEKRYKEARTPEEKISTLQEMLKLIPKHKGTDHLQGDIKRRLKQLREAPKKKSGVRRVISPYVIGRAGAGQVVLFGPPNSGKSALMAAVTNAQVTVAEYPYATTLPTPGMMDFDTVRVQLIDTPPVPPGACDPELASLLRRADLALLVLHAADSEVLDQLVELEVELRRHHVQLVADPEGDHEVEVIGGAVKTLVVITGLDLEGGEVALELLGEMLGDRLPLMGLSPPTGEGLDDFRWRVWELLDMIRVYSKEPGKKPDMKEPFFLPEGGTILDLARGIHKDLARGLKLARLWGHGVHDGQAVQRDHELHDGDIVELHA